MEVSEVFNWKNLNFKATLIMNNKFINQQVHLNKFILIGWLLCKSCPIKKMYNFYFLSIVHYHLKRVHITQNYGRLFLTAEISDWKKW